jgi:hypothetical protein
MVRIMQVRIGEIAVQSRYIYIAVCAVGAVMVVACSSDPESSSSAGGGTTVAPVVTAAQADTSADVANTGVGADSLEALLITSLPDGYAQVDDAEADTGASDLAKAARDDGGADAEAVLTGAGFVEGFQRSWQTQDQTGLIIAFLYEFSEADGAAMYAERAIETFESDPALAAVPFEVDGIPDANGRSLTNLEVDGGLASSIVFSTGGYLVQIVVIGPTGDANQALAQQLAQDQFDRL